MDEKRGFGAADSGQDQQGGVVDASQSPVVQPMGEGIQDSAVEPQAGSAASQGWAVQPQGADAQPAGEVPQPKMPGLQTAGEVKQPQMPGSAPAAEAQPAAGDAAAGQTVQMPGDQAAGAGQAPFGQPQQPAQSPYAQPQQPGAVPGGAPYYGAPSQMGQPAPQSGGSGVGALVCGILAIVFCWAPLVGIILGIVAIVMASKAVKRGVRNGKVTGGKICGIAGIVLSVIMFIVALALSIFVVNTVANSTTTDVSRSYSYSSTEDSSDYALPTDADDAAVQEAACAEIDKLVSQDPEVIDWMAQKIDDVFSSSSGYSLTELGVDPTSMAQWMTTDFSYKPDGAYADSDGTGTMYAEVELRDMYEMLTTFNTSVQDLQDSGALDGVGEAEALAQIGQQLTAAMDSTDDMTDYYTAVELTKEGDTWVVDQDDWQEELEYMFGLF